MRPRRTRVRGRREVDVDGVEDDRRGAAAIRRSARSSWSGLGGVLAELLADIGGRAAPVDRPTAQYDGRQLRVAPLLAATGVGGPTEVDGLVDIVVAVSEVDRGRAGPSLQLELNPVLVTRQGSVALDALLRRTLRDRRMTGGETWSRLAAHGVDTVFGIPGTHNLEIYRHLAGPGSGTSRPATSRAPGYAADGYARTTGRPGVRRDHHRPGAAEHRRRGRAGVLGLGAGAVVAPGHAAAAPGARQRTAARDARPAAAPWPHRGRAPGRPAMPSWPRRSAQAFATGGRPAAPGATWRCRSTCWPRWPT